MCTPSADELVTLREFLACKDPNDATKTHTFSYLIDEEDQRVAEEILETSVSSPWEMIRSLTQEDSGGGGYEGRGHQWSGLQGGNSWQPTQTDLAPSAIFVPKVLNGGADTTSSASPAVPKAASYRLPTGAASRAGTASSESLRQLTAMAKSQLEATTTTHPHQQHAPTHATGTARHHPAPQQHLIVERRAPRSHTGEGRSSIDSSANRSAIKFPILGDDVTSHGGPTEGTGSMESSSSQVGIKLLKVFENDDFITFKKVYPASMGGGTALASVGAHPRSSRSPLPPSLGGTESRGQSETSHHRASRSRDSRRDPPERRLEVEGHTNVISEETKVSSSGARQVLIVVSSKNKAKGTDTHR